MSFTSCPDFIGGEWRSSAGGSPVFNPSTGEVIAEFRKSPVPDLILLDVMLPDTDGFDILLRLRQHPALQNVPVIMLTGKATREAVIKGLAGGADGYITKPFEADALMRAVRTVIGLTQEQALPHTAGDPWSNRDAKA